jgi:putative ABC transport system permease protein
MASLTRDDRTSTAVALIGVPADATQAPRPLAEGAHGIVVDAATGLHAGDRVTIQPGGISATVSGTESLGTIAHAPVAYVSLPIWQRARYGASDTQAPPARVSGFLLDTDGARVEHVVAAVEALGHDGAPSAVAVAATPGYLEETGTINMIRGFLLAIAALLVGTVFWILTLQKEAPLAVLRATGAGAPLLLGAYLIQVTATVVVGIGIGACLAMAAGASASTTAFALTIGDAATAASLLGLLAVGASATSMRRLVTIDPLLSLGRLP